LDRFFIVIMAAFERVSGKRFPKKCEPASRGGC
jgi:hypothetical protein